MRLIDPAKIPAATEDDIYEALAALNEEIRRRVEADGGLAEAVRVLYPTAVGLLCAVEHSSGYPTAEPSGVLLADGTTVDVGKHHPDEGGPCGGGAGGV
ncbi:hypothetical protein [Frankia sp. Cppng1_Ct_nod]|uniref:hypothetical protein n=1 Tax=Frankia sp. Cppng1_Ct_nod TaxID=2897162 RepID=UPI0013EFB658|nr:hypothetical protein [Frankia sp. Cppng1_Ct_nod]